MASTRTPRSWDGYRTTSCSANGCLRASAISRATACIPDAAARECLRRRTRFGLRDHPVKNGFVQLDSRDHVKKEILKDFDLLTNNHPSNEPIEGIV
jgi:hypothetical protein